MQSVGRLWLANIARGAWSGERAAVGWGYLGWGKAPTPSAARSSEERYTQRDGAAAAGAHGESDSADRDRKSERR